MESVQKSAEGISFIATIKEGGSAVDVSTASTLQLIFRKPDGTTLTKTASLDDDGTDGKIKYDTASGDLDTVGLWSIQGYVAFPSGFDGRSNSQVFRVRDNL